MMSSGRRGTPTSFVRPHLAVVALERDERTVVEDDHGLRARRSRIGGQPGLIAVSFAVLAAYVGVESLRDLVTSARPESSIVGIVMAALSLAVMPLLARAKARLARVLGSAAAVADSKQTNLCALLSAVLLVGLGANQLFGWWWADPVAGVGISSLAGAEAVRTWRAESLADTSCA